MHARTTPAATLGLIFDVTVFSIPNGMTPRSERPTADAASEQPEREPSRKGRKIVEYSYISVERFDDNAILAIAMARPRYRNAQNRGLLVELNHALLAAEADDQVRVVILRGEGTSFSAGHDMGTSADLAERAPGPDQHPTYRTHGGTRAPTESHVIQEWHFFYEYCRRWRSLRKITIAEVQGPVFSAALMLAWACDLIVADSRTVFADVVGTRLGMCGVEYFAHPWEFGPRLTKELLLTGDSIDADRAFELGMVSRVFDPATRQDDTLEFARRVAAIPTMASLLIKDSVNQAVDATGFQSALQSAFTMHQLNHAHWAVETNGEYLCAPPPAAGQSSFPPVTPRSKEKPR